MLALLRLSVLLLAFLAFAPAAHAQAHDTGPNSFCRFGPPWHIRPESGHDCEACLADKENEAKAIREEQARRGKAANARALAEKTALEVASAKKRQQDADRQRSAEVLINGGELYRPVLSKATKTTGTYKVVDGFSLNNPPDVTKASLSKVLCDGKLVFSSTRFSYITLKYFNNFTPYFVGTLPRAAGGCSNLHLNNEILLDKTGKQIKFGNIEQFGFLDSSLQDPEHIEVVIYKNACKNFEDNRGYKSQWPTIRHLYSLITMQEVEANDSSQLDECNCP